MYSRRETFHTSVHDRNCFLQNGKKQFEQTSSLSPQNLFLKLISWSTLPTVRIRQVSHPQSIGKGGGGGRGGGGEVKVNLGMQLRTAKAWVYIHTGSLETGGAD